MILCFTNVIFQPYCIMYKTFTLFCCSRSLALDSLRNTDKTSAMSLWPRLPAAPPLCGKRGSGGGCGAVDVDGVARSSPPSSSSWMVCKPSSSSSCSVCRAGSCEHKKQVQWYVITYF